MLILNSKPSIANKFIAEMRDPAIQKDRFRFRKNLERLGEILAYEISKTLKYQQTETSTPLGKASIELPVDELVLFSVLRASLPFYQGFLNFFDQAESGFIGAYREENKNQQEIHINLGYVASPSIENKVIILADPMLATGRSFIKSIQSISQHGKPKCIHIAAAVAAPEGIAYIKENMKLPHKIWIGALDEKLNSSSYIIPGLGDAGDLAFGPKL
ncbi:uracil phosphoribosyltransferase [Algoriphagus faecimaris]|uniref:Uracil phosphoribosyltransferase n=1 Tax=Algoriphagus faecimaris TaxID=686796 RepID=A0A1G6X792_9BACT|nr:uracil phosphoribosyltransferase [Algoriphagus faecimaris]SDD73196.1 uracil phosphoribosyltransferase [Algoriphagus faecimaris]